MRYLLFLFFLSAGFFESLAQEYLIPNQWWLQQPLFNPATSGMDAKLSAAVGTRLPGYETLFYGSYTYGRIDAKIDALNSGLGFSYFNQNPEYLGRKDEEYLMQQRFAINYNYQFQFKNNHILAIGAAAEFLVTSWNIDGIGPDGVFDPALPAPSGIGTDINLGFGALYKAEDWHVGFSVLPAIPLVDAENLTNTKTMFYAIAAAMVPLSDALGLEYALLAVFDQDLFFAINPNLKLWLINKYYVGLGLGYSDWQSDAADLLLGIDLYKGLSAHYVYSFTISDFSSIKNQHVIGLHYLLAD